MVTRVNYEPRSWRVRLVLAWCRVYTSLAVASERARRREEMSGHLWNLEQNGGPVLRRYLRGAIDDLRWCDETRRAVGRPGLLASTVTGETGGLVTSGVLMLIALIVSTAGSLGPKGLALPGLAGLVFVIWFSVRQLGGRRSV